MVSTATDTPRFRRADAERNGERIIEAAARLLAEDPHAGMAAIAAEAGVTPGTVNRHFNTREQLVAAVFERVLTHSAEVFRGCKLDEGPARRALERLVDGLLGGGPLLLPVELLRQGEAALPPEARTHHYERE